VHAELVLGHGVKVAKKRVAALMRNAELTGAHRRRRGLTRQDTTAPPAPDLIKRDSTAVMPGVKMVGDITCLPTRQGWLYLASVLDLGTRKLLGYAMAEHMRAELVVDAITMAATHGDLAGGAIFHSDRGSQYTSAVFRDTLDAVRAEGTQPLWNAAPTTALPEVPVAVLLPLAGLAAMGLLAALPGGGRAALPQPGPPLVQPASGPGTFASRSSADCCGAHAPHATVRA